MKSYRIILLSTMLLLFLFTSCEKEIQMNVDPSVEELVVEASINQLTPTLNYVILSTTLDYFNPSLNLPAVRRAKVYITEGEVLGSDTLFDISKRFTFTDLLDSVFPGIYISSDFIGKIQKPYLLEIELKDGRKITGRTFIPKPVTIDSITYWFETNDRDTNAFFYMEWLDGVEQNNYRMALKKGSIPYLSGWGYADRFYTMDDAQINNAKRPFQSFNPYKFGDTLNIYLAQIGRLEYLFWDSFRQAANNGGPFATPVTVKSNVKGAIGSFTGYGLVQKQLIFR